MEQLDQDFGFVLYRHRPARAAKGTLEIADLRDLALMLARTATDSGRRTPLDDVLAAFGHTRESLARSPDDE